MEKLLRTSTVQGGKAKFLDRSITTRELIFILAVVFCLSPWITPPMALLLGLVIAQFIGHPYLHLNHKATHLMLQISVVSLGFGMHAGNAIQAGKSGLLFTVISIVGTMITGYFLGKCFRIDKKTSYLISTGTAICGGSAIAAVSPVIAAEEKQISVALGTVFILNAAALFIFPLIGHALQLSQIQFGLWSAIAIHDTSSVVGAAGKYGTQALEVATTVKLARALWIIPVAFLSTYIFRNRNVKVKIPYFIGLFVLAMLANTYVPFIHQYSTYLTGLGKAGLTLTLFLIGCGLNRKVWAEVGLTPILQGILLWVLISAAALWAVMSLA